MVVQHDVARVVGLDAGWEHLRHLVDVLLSSLPKPPPIQTGRENAGERSAERYTSTGASGAAQFAASAGQNSNYQIAAHVPPGYVLSSPKLYESPNAATKAYQRNSYNTSNGGAFPSSGSGMAPKQPTAAAAATAAAGGSRVGAGAVLGASSDGHAGLPLSTAGSTSGGKQKVLWGDRKPLRKDASWFALSVLLLYIAAVIYYLYVRIAFTLNMKDKWYSIIVLIVECIGISAVIPYGVINVCHTHPSGSPGLPVDDGTLSPDKT